MITFTIWVFWILVALAVLIGLFCWLIGGMDRWE